ncbi:TPA: type IV secretion system protein VirB10 [Pseudomonas aeruginosa]|uniref:type IV secretion system protein VirB10 n=1 Tax=Pseudomonas aeruginosa TaxID=287 RepID=UPI000E33612F|nr:type IV secretion system protein VirB10 [Pseudomonas aeruginosa]MDP2556118.1 type IV secretion system protein VirB10 [Pseudomonas aeruginosa]QPN17985.1 type IV secretion system protein VirB10 [Pseudomonas aeruginosa]SYY08076.1 Type IV secretion system protein virB10 [Acinetobacter baumannii]HBN8448264.1 type IV secretion system protein VirB10 [Pseudomonas aeruginosa]
MNDQQNTQAELASLDGERGIPSVNHEGPSTKKRALVLLVILLVLAFAGLVGYWLVKKQAARDAEATAAKNLQLTSAVPPRTFTEPPAKRPPELPGTGQQAVQPQPVVPALGQGTGAASAPPLPGDGGYDGKPKPMLDKSASSLMVATKASQSRQSGIAQGEGQGGGQDARDGQGGMTALLSSTKTATRQAGMIGNRNFLLAKGAFIDCALQTKLDSTVPGMTACVVTRNIYSDNGKVLLIERGSTVSGEYQANMRQGMARIYVLWSRIKTPNGVIINLDSPGTDPLGGAGLPGYVDNHFWQRFGGALMLSLVDDVARGLTNSIGNNNNSQQNFNFNSTGDTTQNMAAEALRNTINIPPTLYKNQGEQVGIYVARDLDFSSVYDVAAQ